MEEENFSEILNGTKDLTIGQIFRLFTKIKYKTALLFISIFLTITGSAFVAGQSSIEQKAAVMLNSPFSMKITVNNKDYILDKLTLIEDPAFPDLGDDHIMLSLRQIVSAFDIIQVGQVMAVTHKQKPLPVWEWIFSEYSNNAYAQPKIIFNWDGHERDFSFKEEYKDNNTIHRFYSDGCILEYKVDNNRRSIPESFRWIRKTH